MCLARRADKIEARDHDLPIVAAHRAAKALLAYRTWCRDFGYVFARIGRVAACGEVGR